MPSVPDVHQELGLDMTGPFQRNGRYSCTVSYHWDSLLEGSRSFVADPSRGALATLWCSTRSCRWDHPATAAVTVRTDSASEGLAVLEGLAAADGPMDPGAAIGID